MDRTQSVRLKPIGMIAGYMSVLDSIVRPEHTGDNRCYPCTVVNAVGVALVSFLVARRSRFGAVAVALVAGALIWLRGYVIPYTPQFGPQIADRLPIAFGHGPNDADPSDSIGGDTDPEAVLTGLFEAGVLVEDGDLFLAEAFETAWNDRMADLRDLDDAALAANAAAAVPFDAESGVQGNRLLVAGPHDLWLTRPVAIAETAALEALVKWGVDRETAAKATHPLRTFLYQCPSCAGPLAETTYQNCCGGTRGVYGHPERSVLACQACGALLFEFDE